MTFSSGSVYLLEQLQNSEKQFAYQIFCCLVTKSCLTLLQPHGLYCSPSGPSVHGISQAKKKKNNWNGLPFPSPEYFSNPRIKPTSPVSPALQVDSLLAEAQGKPMLVFTIQQSESAIIIAQPLSRVRLFATAWTVAYQAPLSMGFSRPEYWSGLPFPSPISLPNPGIEPGSPVLQPDAFTI